ncbi:PEP/pyruvate-binding domain-containing protein [Streptomyces sp. AC555_RSS877]|uniref:PEP/pyruvate-binding domain-containing protein n=1 Tax=Streptomyces sp. AC555_RSS877 TaxID=2823688 RepID=UPI001C2779B7|nr:PEP/pyruvate-binding domain-containing protein [Streptomyces sp. AC555_RSS877]
MSKAENLALLESWALSAPVPAWTVVRHGELVDPQALNALPGDLFAVRSSADCEDGSEHSFAGLFDTMLGVRREDVAQAVRTVRASADSKRSRTYLGRIGIPRNGVRMDVIVQTMLRPRIAGVAFSCHPVPGERGRVIEVVRGLGELLVSGSIDGDRVVIDPESGAVTSYEVHHQSRQLVTGSHGTRMTAVPLLRQSARKLTRREIGGIERLLLDVQDRMGCHVDIEFAYDGDTLYLLQARPMTVVPDEARSA